MVNILRLQQSVQMPIPRLGLVQGAVVRPMTATKAKMFLTTFEADQLFFSGTG